MKPNMTMRYAIGDGLEWATIETSDGYYVCTVERTLGESRVNFHKRARQILLVLLGSKITSAQLYARLTAAHRMTAGGREGG